MKKKIFILNFQKPETDPTKILKNKSSSGTTLLSPYLKFGCLSPRKFYNSLIQLYNEAKGKHSSPPESLLGQLLWREFFYLVAYMTPNYSVMKGNKICKQIDWDDHEHKKKAWAEGRTGYPWIDAIMKQLISEGWIHHLARHCVACFLTRGDLYQSWQFGVEIFDRYLLDADWSLNVSNWLWLSCSCFFQTYWRVYSPVAFPKKYSGAVEFVRYYLPVLKDMPDNYVLEPWKAPKWVQEKAKCIVGTDYPLPIVDHAQVSKQNITRIAEAFKKTREEKKETQRHPPVDKPVAKRKVVEISGTKEEPKKRRTSQKKI
eukprot:TRINITY_DN2395_c0_g1_i2.p1 TRINITY_DN2395_c0_g1~~TRINITY_DN2395_c0_g1_i2.p1  ORF type:complete len:316 (-),score=57.05 TRINITY_DN2395_c0_g1_i2:55-1002(-)